MNNSFWWQSLPPWQPLPPLAESIDVDVAIVGAGYTGLWSAYFLHKAQPNLQIAIFEAEHVGFGASGRNGGWVSSFWPTPIRSIAKKHGPEIAIDFQRYLHKLVDEFGQEISVAGIDADFDKAGTVNLARSEAQKHRLLAELDEYRSLGFTSADYDFTLELSKLPAATNVQGGLTSPNCATIHPAKLVRGLAEKVLSQGTKIFENSRVSEMSSNQLKVNGKNIYAKSILIANEGYRHELIPRATAPIHSLMFISDPIPKELLDELRIKPGLTFNDARNLIIYGQRTAENRIAFGGRGAPYRLGSKTGTNVEMHQPAFSYLKSALGEMFPPLVEYLNQPSHTWGGPIGVARDWQPSIWIDRKSGIISAGNYVGDGVAASYLAGQTVADLITEQKTKRISFPWVQHRSPKWEVEPARYFLINAARTAIGLSDRLEAKMGSQSMVSKLLWRILKR